MKSRIYLVLFGLLLTGVVVNAQTDYMKQWPQFRGPYASGIVETNVLPFHWDVTTGENILWKLKIPGLGHSSPGQIIYHHSHQREREQLLKGGIIWGC